MFYLNNKNIKDAILYSNKIKELSYDESFSIREISINLAKTGNTDNAIKIAENIFDDYEKCFTFLILAEEIDKQGNKNLANKMLNQALILVKNY